MDGERRYLKIFDRFGRAIRLTNERWTHIISHHPVIRNLKEEMKETLRDPKIVRRSVYDPSVLIYYRYFKDVLGGKYIAVVVKVNNIKGFILTSYVTDRVKRGDEVWRKEQKEERKSV